MRNLATTFAVILGLALNASAYGQARHDEKPHGPPKQQARQAVDVAGPAIELKNGEKIVVAKDGTMAHYNAAGQRIKMRDGQVMEAKDGSTLMMKNNAIWKQITERGTLRPVQ